MKFRYRVEYLGHHTWCRNGIELDRLISQEPRDNLGAFVIVPESTTEDGGIDLDHLHADRKTLEALQGIIDREKRAGRL